MSHPSERRRLQRVKLLEPLAGKIDAQRILILDVSRTGMRVAHQERIADDGGERVIEFEWDGRRVALECRVTDSHLQRVGAASYARSIYHSGLIIVAPSPGSADVLREMIEWHVRRALDEQKADARGVAPPGERSFQAGKTKAYARHQFAAGAWRQVRTGETSQPTNGFTISAARTRQDVGVLRAAWETGDPAARAMIQKMAEQSISRAD